MPTLGLAVDELTTHIFLPVIRQISHRILKLLNYDEEIGDRIFINTDWTAASKSSDINNNPILGQQCFKVEANIQLNPTSQKWDCYTFHHTAAYGVGVNIKNSTFPIFHDPVNNVHITEMISPVTIALNCELCLQSIELAWKTPQMIFNGYENGCVIHFNDLAYDYPIPKPIISILFKLWEMDRDYGKPAKVDFIQYLQKRTQGTWSYHKHRELNEYEIVKPCFDLKSLATLEYSEDKPTGIMKDKLPVAWSIPFQYTVQFGMPTLNILSYPVVYNNQLVPSTCIPVNENIRYNNMDESHHGIADEGYAVAFNEAAGRYAGTARFPKYDDWNPPQNSRCWNNAYRPFMIFALVVEEQDMTIEDFSVDLPGEVQLTPLTKECLYQQGTASMSTGVLYNVSLFKNNTELKPGEDFNFDRDLRLSFKAADTHSQYHFVMSAITDLNYFDVKSWIHLVFKWFPFFPPYIQAWVKSNIENKRWYNNKWPGRVIVTPTGDIYDAYGKKLSNLGDLDLQEVTRYAAYSPSRIIRYNIIPRKAKDFKTRIE